MTPSRCRCDFRAVLVNEFKAQVHNKAKKIDPNNSLDWYSLTVGWAIGNGLTTARAREFAQHIRYHTELG